MRSTATSSRLPARQGAHLTAPPARALARAGLAARGVIYILIGWVAILVALGRARAKLTSRALCSCSPASPAAWSRSGCSASGLPVYALWRLSEAAFGVTGEGNGAGPRLKSLVRGLIYASLPT